MAWKIPVTTKRKESQEGLFMGKGLGQNQKLISKCAGFLGCMFVNSVGQRFYLLIAILKLFLTPVFICITLYYWCTAFISNYTDTYQY